MSTKTVTTIIQYLVQKYIKWLQIKTEDTFHTSK